MRPTKYLAKWSRRDRGLAEGFIALEESLNDLGIPSWIARDSTREWDTDEVMDYPAQAIGEVRDEYADGGKSNHGLRIVVVPRSAPDERADELHKPAEHGDRRGDPGS